MNTRRLLKFCAVLLLLHLHVATAIRAASLKDNARTHNKKSWYRKKKYIYTAAGVASAAIILWYVGHVILKTRSSSYRQHWRVKRTVWDTRWEVCRNKDKGMYEKTVAWFSYCWFGITTSATGIWKERGV